MRVDIGERTSLSKTVTEADIALFAAISGDFDPIHVDEEYAKATPFAGASPTHLRPVACLSGAESAMSRRIANAGGP
jgi:acyl dehydratase